jgi:Rieske Fe-S protein
VNANSRDPRSGLDPLINSPDREGLTGTAPSEVYVPRRDQEMITTAPDRSPADRQPAWREDFPIAALTAGQFWIAGQNWLRTRRGLPEVRRIASVDDIPAAGSLVFQYPGELDHCVLVRLSPGEFVAYSQKCTHLSCAVIPEPDKGVLHCPCHDGFFDLRSGAPTAGPPQRPLPRITLEIRGRDIYATGVEMRTV